MLPAPQSHGKSRRFPALDDCNNQQEQDLWKVWAQHMQCCEDRAFWVPPLSLPPRLHTQTPSLLVLSTNPQDTLTAM